MVQSNQALQRSKLKEKTTVLQTREEKRLSLYTF